MIDIIEWTCFVSIMKRTDVWGPVKICRGKAKAVFNVFKRSMFNSCLYCIIQINQIAVLY